MRVRLLVDTLPSYEYLLSKIAHTERMPIWSASQQGILPAGAITTVVDLAHSSQAPLALRSFSQRSGRSATVVRLGYLPDTPGPSDLVCRATTQQRLARHERAHASRRTRRPTPQSRTTSARSRRNDPLRTRTRRQTPLGLSAAALAGVEQLRVYMPVGLRKCSYPANFVKLSGLLPLRSVSPRRASDLRWRWLR